MGYQLVRTSAIDERLPVRACGSATSTRFDDAYLLLCDDEPRWQVVVGWGMDGPGPFREELIWVAAGVVAIGGGVSAHLVNLGSGEPQARFEVPDWFGHFGLDEAGRSLCILGWRHVIAVDLDLSIRWRARDVAVDGLVPINGISTEFEVRAEMDPPGNWVDVILDAATGQEISRSPTSA